VPATGAAGREGHAEAFSGTIDRKPDRYAENESCAWTTAGAKTQAASSTSEAGALVYLIRNPLDLSEIFLSFRSLLISMGCGLGVAD
jgi:hypothetical protein